MEVLQTLEGHADRVWSVAWSPSGNLLASSSGDKTVRIWAKDPEGVWRCTAVLEETHTRTVRSCEWSPCGKYLAAASFDGTTSIWQHAGGEFECLASLEGHENEVKSAAWAASGALLATCSRDKSVWIWEMQAGGEFECVSVLAGHAQDVKMVRWHPRRELLVSTSYDDSIKVWAEEGDGDDWRCVQTLAQPGSGHSSTVWGVAFERDGDRMVSCSDDLTLQVWDSSTDPGGSGASAPKPWKHLSTIAGYHERTIFSVDWSWANGLIASGAGDDCIRIFGEDSELPGGVGQGPSFSLLATRSAAHSTDVNCVRWHPKDGRLLASAGDDGAVKLWCLEGSLEGLGAATDRGV